MTPFLALAGLKVGLPTCLLSCLALVPAAPMGPLAVLVPDEVVEVDQDAEEPVDANPVAIPAEDEAAQEATEPAPLPDGVAARGGDVDVSLAELDRLLIERHGKRPEGMDILNRLVVKGVLEELAAAAGVDFGDEAIDARMFDIDQQMRAADMKQGLAAALVEGNIDIEVFRQMLRLSLIQAALTASALGLEEGAKPSAGQQNAWMDEILAKRGISEAPELFPTKDEAIVASSGEAVVTMGDFRERLRNELDSTIVWQACTQMVLQKILRAQAGTIDDALWAAAIDKELKRRGEKHNLDPQIAGTGISYETMLDAQGLSLAMMAEDPSVQVTALTTILARRKAIASSPEDLDPSEEREARITAGLRATYETEREFFDGYFGPRLPLRVCMKRAVPIANDLVRRSVAETMSYLEKLIPEIDSEAKFVELVLSISDELNTKRVEGALGVYGRGDERLPEGMRTAAWAYWDATPVPGVTGPIEVSGGVALIWIGQAIPAPPQSEMDEIVESELQRRILNDAMPEEGIRVFRAAPTR